MMSVTSLPEWKQLLLEKKRRDEEERERREKEEEQKFANMPAWKRGIIQRRKAKQENLGDREKERDIALAQVDVRSLSDGLSDTDSSLTVNLGSDPSFSPDPGLWLDEDLKSLSQVSLETIVPFHENPFIRTQSVLRKGRDGDVVHQERAIDVDYKEKEKGVSRSSDVDMGRGRDIELRIERFRDLSEGREKERSRDRSQGREREHNKEVWKETAKESSREKEHPKSKREEDEADVSCSMSSTVSSLRTIRADNIIIIEQDRKFSDEKMRRWIDVERDRPEEDHQGKRGMKMDLREILAGGGSVTEIRASEVLIIKPLAGSDERTPPGGGKDYGREHGEMKEAKGRDARNDMCWVREKEMVREKDRPCGQATVIKEDRKDSSDDSVFIERGGRVSQLLSKFGEHPKLPSRSKSSDNFLRSRRRTTSGDEEDHEYEGRKNAVLKGAPKRSFSFSDRVISSKENGFDDGMYYHKNIRDRIHSERSVAQWVDVASLGKATTAKIKLGCARLLDKDKIGRHGKNEEQHKSEPKWSCPIQKRMDSARSTFTDRRAAEKANDTEGDEGFTVASVKNIEGVSFARRVPIRQDVKAKAAELKRQTGHRSNQKPTLGKRDQQSEERLRDKRVPDSLKEEACKSMPRESVHAAGDFCRTADNIPRRVLDSSDSSTQTYPTSERGGEWSSRDLTELCQTHAVLSQQTEELINKIEKVGEAYVCSERGERAHRSALDATKDSKCDLDSESRIQSVAPKSPKGVEQKDSQDVHIPRSVFYVADEMMDISKDGGQNNKGHDVDAAAGVDTGRDGGRKPKSLSSIESLREKIKQRKLRQKETQDGNASENEELTDVEAADDRRPEVATRSENATHLQQAEKLPAPSTSMTAPDVTPEAGAFMTCPQLPVSVPHSQEEVTNTEAANAEAVSDKSQSSEDEEELSQQHVEGQHEEEDRNEEEIQEEVEEEYIPDQSAESLSPSPTHPNSLTAMSRIYNLETVGSRSGLCLRDRNVESSTVQLVQVRPLAPDTKEEDRRVFSSEDAGGVQALQRHIERFQFSDQEEKPSQDSKEIVQDDVQDKSKETEDMRTRDFHQHICSPTSHLKQMITPALLRSQSPEASLKSSDLAPTPASSPCSPSPTLSPSASPSPSPSPTLFSIKSASGGHVKRGATMTITPKKPGKVPSPINTNAAHHQGPVAASKAEPVKRYLAVEEIQVIGGYLVEKSCLVKSKGIMKKGKVCFDEEQLEQVCEYPSETSMLVSNPQESDRSRANEAHKEEVHVPAVVSKTQKNVVIPTGRGLRVGQFHPFLKKHNV
ncbi:uncharacterized protein ppp1r18 isoform X1 [Synchiropus splendidus]|uniref:uncharacterized protein ppp1r18 isoform X1 n=1 Tax=Synchiropus splendidus TaxID=270530 RepID=UPI00237DC8A5|nr:uncharacterized protein ppp1r18 isoform X1 [Synchiropus splendidus]